MEINDYSLHYLCGVWGLAALAAQKEGTFRAVHSSTSTTTHPSATLDILTKIGPIVLKFCGYARVNILMMIVHFFYEMLWRERDKENGLCHAGRWMPGRRFNSEAQSCNTSRLSPSCLLNEHVSQLRDTETKFNSTC